MIIKVEHRRVKVTHPWRRSWFYDEAETYFIRRKKPLISGWLAPERHSQSYGYESDVYRELMW